MAGVLEKSISRDSRRLWYKPIVLYDSPPTDIRVGINSGAKDTSILDSNAFAPAIFRLSKAPNQHPCQLLVMIVEKGTAPCQVN